MTADEFRELQVDTKGNSAALASKSSRKRVLMVVSRMETPASKAGIKVGDFHTAERQAGAGVPLAEMIDEMRGPSNTRSLTITRAWITSLEISMRRAVIHIQVVKQRMEPGNIGYVRLTEFSAQADATKTAVQSSGSRQVAS